MLESQQTGPWALRVCTDSPVVTKRAPELQKMLAPARTIRSPIGFSASLAGRLEITRKLFDDCEELIVYIACHLLQGFFLGNPGILIPVPGTLTPPVFISPRSSEGKYAVMRYATPLPTRIFIAILSVGS
jgi:hypothetical protein